MSDVPDCLACGTCCFTPNPRMVELLGIDEVATPEEWVVQEPDGSKHMRMLPTTVPGIWVCAAHGADHVCKIYARRPFLCREFERGSPDCQEAIAVFPKGCKPT